MKQENLDWAIAKFSEQTSLGFDEMTDVMNLIMSGTVPTGSIAQFLTGLHEKGATVDELAGAAKALQQKMARVECDRPHLIDTCGTGGSGKNTFNISTAAALVTAAAGATVAKHGNRAITGKSGSADVLQELGVKVDASLAVSERCLNELGICFCFAPLFHSSVKHASEARKKLDFPTIFNLLGPLCNPARAPYQLLGAGRAETRGILASALAILGTTKAAVVHGRDGIGEVSIGQATDVSLVENGQVEPTAWDPEDFGVDCSEVELIQVNSPQHSAEIIRGVLAGEAGPPREIVVANSAAALWISGMVADFQEGSKLAGQAITGGRAKDLLAQLVQMSKS